jgi:isopenicillin N synthase-like dioxygenase
MKSKLLYILLALLPLGIAAENGISATFDPTIHVVDLTEFRNPATRGKFLSEMTDALRDVGFFAVVNTNVDQDTLDAGYAAAERFYAQDLATKMEINDPITNGQRGYVASESAKGEDMKDFKEFLHVGPELTSDEHEHLGIASNLWPTSMELKSPLVSLRNALSANVAEIEEALAEALDQPLDLFSSKTKNGDTLLRSIHYPANPPKDAIWAAEHTDIDLFTILPMATAEGLQVKNREGDWITVRVPENAFIVNGGEMLENITNGEFRAGPHRVIAMGANEHRYSMVLFVHCRSHEDVSPLAKSIERTGGVRRYADATELDLLSERLADLGLASEVTLKHLADSGLMERLLEVGRASPEAMRALDSAGLASEKIRSELAEMEAHKAAEAA